MYGDTYISPAFVSPTYSFKEDYDPKKSNNGRCNPSS